MSEYNSVGSWPSDGDMDVCDNFLCLSDPEGIQYKVYSKHNYENKNKIINTLIV